MRKYLDRDEEKTRRKMRLLVTENKKKPRRKVEIDDETYDT